MMLQILKPDQQQRCPMPHFDVTIYVSVALSVISHDAIAYLSRAHEERNMLFSFLFGHPCSSNVQWLFYASP
jgi:hypothetical protein